MDTSATFLEVTRHTSAEQLLHELYDNPHSNTVNQFFFHNIHIAPHSTLEPGAIIFAPPIEPQMCIAPSDTSEALQELNNTYQSLSPEQRETYHQLHPLLDRLERYNNATEEDFGWREFNQLGTGITSSGNAGLTSISKYVELTSHELGQYRTLYIDTLRSQGYLGGYEFYQARSLINRRLNFLTSGFLQDIMLPDINPNKPLHKIAGSVKSAERGWKLKGETGVNFKELAKYETHLMNYTWRLERADKLFLKLDIAFTIGDVTNTFMSKQGLYATGRVVVVDATKVGASYWTDSEGAVVGSQVGRAIGTGIGLVIGAIAGFVVGEVICPWGEDLLWQQKEQLKAQQ